MTTPVNTQNRLQLFARYVLATLEAQKEWNADTIEQISAAAAEYGLAGERDGHFAAAIPEQLAGPGLSIEQLVDKQGEAFEEIALGAEIDRIPAQLRTTVQKQRHFIAAQPDRCMRCGAHCAGLVVGMGPAICSPCSTWLEQLEAPVKWFASLMREAGARHAARRR